MRAHAQRYKRVPVSIAAHRVNNRRRRLRYIIEPQSFGHIVAHMPADVAPVGVGPIMYAAYCAPHAEAMHAVGFNQSIEIHCLLPLSMKNRRPLEQRAGTTDCSPRGRR